MDAEAPSWGSLPANVLVGVFKQLPVLDLCSCSMVCRQFYTAAQTEGIWKALMQLHYNCTGPTQYATSCKQSFVQLKTATLWSCGTYCCNLQTTPAGSSSSTTLHQVWSNTPTAKPLPLNMYCPALPRDFAVDAVATGSSHLVLLSCTGEVIDTRAVTAAAGNAALPGEGLVPAEPEAPAYADDPVNQQLAQLGLGDHAHQQQQQQQQQQPGVLQLLNPWRPPAARITAIAAGSCHVLSVTSSGDVWGWGSNVCGQLGLAHNNSWQATPVDITQVLDGAWKANGDVITLAACGDAHSVLLATGGAVYTAGCNKHGQCAQGVELQMCTVFCQPLQPLGAAAAVACGVANTAVATVTGRLLVCGDSSSGQCGAGWLKAGCCHEFVDLGPELSWHGLTRPSPAQVAAVGGNVLDALPKVVQVAMGSGTGYAVTFEGEVFAWGAGSKGQLGRGGCTKVQATPAKLPWAKHVTQVSTSLEGAFAAAVDEGGHLYTWGAGKWGQLGHGDTSKRTVGRAVKQLKHLSVLQAVCGDETLVVLTCHRPHTGHNSTQHSQSELAAADALAAADMRSNSSASLPRSSSMLSTGSRGSMQGRGTSSKAAAGIGDADNADLSCMDGVDWVDVDGQGPFYCPQPRSGYARKGSRAARAAAARAANSSCEVARSDALAMADLADPSTSGYILQDHQTSIGSAAAATTRASGLVGLNSGSRLPRTSSSTSSSSGSRYSKSSSNRHRRYGATGHDSADACAGTQNEASTSAAAAAACLELDDEGHPDHCEAGLPGERRERMDKGFKRLLKRLLKQFVVDSKERELTFPASLSAADRYHIHVAADEWGLGHASHNDDNGDRVIKVWKLSRSRKMHMVSGAAADYGS